MSRTLPRRATRCLDAPHPAIPRQADSTSNRSWYIEAPDVPEGAWRKTAKGAVNRAFKMWLDNMARVRIVAPNGRDALEITSGGYFRRVDDSIRKYVEALDNR